MSGLFKPHVTGGLRPLAIGLALALFGPPVPVLASPAADARWERAIHDPRLRHVDRLDLAGRSELAREYGLENLLPGQVSGGATWFVTNCDDSGGGSLRRMIASAASGDIVNATGLTCASITLTSGQIPIPQADLTIIGPGKHSLSVISGNGSKYDNRLFQHTGTGTLAVAGISLAGGNASASTGRVHGGCIDSAGSVVLGNPLFFDDRASGVDLSGCRVFASAADGRATGGGVSAVGSLTLTNSVISGCSVSASGSSGLGFGGGAYSSGAVTVKYGEFNDNAATGNRAYGGGLAVSNDSGSIFITASTFAANAAPDGNGGGAFVDAPFGTVEVHNTTVTGNTALAWAGLSIVNIVPPVGALIANTTITANVASGVNFGSGMILQSHLRGTLESTIVYGNFRTTAIPDDLGVGTAKLGWMGSHNLVGVSDQPPPADTINADPRLGPLGYHGGPTRTRQLGADSPAVDRGDNSAGEDNDQRGAGYPRIVGASADIGAYEFDQDRIFHDGFD